jgi:magnesium transporter
MDEVSEQHSVAELLAPELAELIEARLNFEARSALLELLDPEVADVLMLLEPNQRAVAFRLLPRDRQAEVFVLLSSEAQEQLLSELNNEQLAHLMSEIEPDDRAELFEEMPGQLAAKLLNLMTPEQRRQTQVILGYPPQSIGRLMTPDYLTLGEDMTVQQALEHIRRFGHHAESLNRLYVVDDRGRLQDDVALRDILLSDPQTRVDSFMDRAAPSLRASADREEAVRMMERYDMPVLPVVDRDDVLVGIVTFDDVADVAEEEVTEDIQKMGGMEALSEPYLSAPVFELVRKRGVWLAILFVGGILTIMTLGMFQDQIDRVFALALFMPLIIASGGNSGSQAASLIIRAMALGEVNLRDWARVVRRELVSGLTLGLSLGLLGMGIVQVLQLIGWIDLLGHHILISATVATALIGVVTCGTLVGSMLPFILKRFGLDPATGSTPMVATVVDVTGLLIYFTTAMFFLRGVTM